MSRTPTPSLGTEDPAYSDPANPIDEIDNILHDFIGDHSRAFYDPKSTPKTAIKIRSSAKAKLQALTAREVEAALDEARSHLYTASQVREAVVRCFSSKTGPEMIKVILEDVGDELQKLNRI